MDDTPKPKRGWLGSIGPAIIVAAVVLGPGSILTSSKVGAQEGYSMLWVLVIAAILMAATVALAGRLGLAFGKTPCRELADRIGQPFAAALGIIVFLIIASFQAANNLAVIAALDSLSPEGGVSPVLVIAVLNLLIVLIVFILQGIYKPVEKAMMAMVFVMILGFLVNLIFAKPDLGAAINGLFPRLERSGNFFPTKIDGVVVDPWWPIATLFATTFSVVGAFYQAYLVREKGWTLTDQRRGLVDAVVGIGVLAGLTAMIMLTAASAFHGKVDPGSLKSAADVAVQLEPTFGSAAKIIFSLGILAGALSSFLVNAMIGGHILADGLRRNVTLNSLTTRICTTAALLAGAGFALWAAAGGGDLVRLIVIAHGMTLLGIPALAAAMLYLALVARKEGRAPVPAWMIGVATITFLISLVLVARTGARLFL